MNRTIDLQKLRFYNEYLHTHHVYDEGESGFHKELTTEVVNKFIEPLNLPKDSIIFDMGCGPGYFLDEMKSKGYTKLTGVTLSKGDIATCQEKGHHIEQHDISFIPYPDEYIDFIFLRHALEHSPYPIFTLMEYNRVLKDKGLLYIEVPMPDCDRAHEFNLNHYSIMGERQLVALLQRCGFRVENLQTLSFTLNINGKDVVEKYYIVLAKKIGSLDVK